MGNVAYMRQTESELQSVHDMVRGLGEMDSLVPFLRQMGVHYALEGVVPEYIDVFEKALFALLADSLKESVWNAEMCAAWVDAATFVKSVMVPALVLARAEADVIKMVNTYVVLYVI